MRGRYQYKAHNSPQRRAIESTGHKRSMGKLGQSNARPALPIKVKAKMVGSNRNTEVCCKSFKACLPVLGWVFQMELKDDSVLEIRSTKEMKRQPMVSQDTW